MLVPTTFFNCESACVLWPTSTAMASRSASSSGNPEHPGSRGRNCARAADDAETMVTDPYRILAPLKRWVGGKETVPVLQLLCRCLAADVV